MRPTTHEARAAQHQCEPAEYKAEPGSDVVRIGLEPAGEEVIGKAEMRRRAGAKPGCFNVNLYACWATGARSTFHWI